jgi:hypothetical protein
MASPPLNEEAALAQPPQVKALRLPAGRGYVREKRIILSQRLDHRPHELASDSSPAQSCLCRAERARVLEKTDFDRPVCDPARRLPDPMETIPPVRKRPGQDAPAAG